MAHFSPPRHNMSDMIITILEQVKIKDEANMKPHQNIVSTSSLYNIDYVKDGSDL